MKQLVTDSVLIIGGGIAGLTAAVECAGAGAQAIVVEKNAVIGGRLAAAIATKSSVGADLDGTAIPKIDALEQNEHIEILTLSELQSISGKPGTFDVSVRERARFVTDACTRCNHCKPVCPVPLPNEYDAGLTHRKAIYTPLVECYPKAWAIDIDACLNTPPNYLPCNRCTEVCEDNAIHFDMPLETIHEYQVGAVVVATGGELVTRSAEEIGYGSHPDIVTSAEMERLLTAPGPTGGFASKPSDEDYPESVLFILDDMTELSVHTAVSQLRRLAEQDIGVLGLLATSQPGEEDLVELTKALPSTASISAGVLNKLEPTSDSGIRVSYAEFTSSQVPEKYFDMVVLGADTRPSAGNAELASVLGADADDDGYFILPGEGTATTAEAIYAVGGCRSPAVLRVTAEEAKSAACAALGHLDPRVLNVAPAAQGDVSGGLSEEAVRAQFERALHALLGSEN